MSLIFIIFFFSFLKSLYVRTLCIRTTLYKYSLVWFYSYFYRYIGDIHRNAQVNGNGFKPKLDDLNEIHSWGLGTTIAPISSHSYNANPLLQEPARYITDFPHRIFLIGFLIKIFRFKLMYVCF